MKKTIVATISILSVIALTLLIPLTASAITELKVGYFHLTPLAMGKPVSSGPPVGAAVDYLKEVAKEMNVALKFKKLPLSSLEKELEDGTIHVALSLSKNPDRASKFVFAEDPFTNMRSAIALRKGNPINEVNSVDDLKHMTIGTYHKGYKSPMLQDDELNLAPSAGDNVMKKNFKKLLHGRIEAVYGPDSTELEYAISKNDLKDWVKILYLPEKSDEIYTVFSKKVSPDLIAKYNAANERVKNSKGYDKFLIPYLTKL